MEVSVSTAKRVSMVILMQHDLDAAVSFYQELGCTLVFRLKGKWAELQLAGIQIGLCPTENTLQETRTGLVFEVEDINLFYEKHKNNFTFLREPLEKVHGIMTSIKDPGGNIIDLYQPTPEKVQELAKKIKEEEACCSSKAGCC